ENYPIAEELKQSTKERGLPLEITSMETREQTNYPFNIIIVPGKSIKIAFSYNTSVYDNVYVENIKLHFNEIITRVTENYRILLKDIQIISGKEKRQILYEFNDTSADYPSDKTIHRLFEAQVQRTPDNICAVGSCQLAVGKEKIKTKKETVQITYRELNEKSNRLAYLLQSKGAQPGTIVAIMVERSVEMITGLLGILKTGAAYLPTDPDYPKERIHYMLKDSNAGILLLDHQSETRISKSKTKPNDITPVGVNHLAPVVFDHNSNDQKQVNGAVVLNLNSSNFETDSKFGFSESELALKAPGNRNPATGLAYIIYTSGTTGNPKGVAVNHKSLVNYINWRLENYRYSPKDVTLQLLSYNFDGFASNFYSGLLSGGKLVMVSKEIILDYRIIVGIIYKKYVTNTSLVPAMYRYLLENSAGKQLESLRFVVLAGESASAALVEKSKAMNPGIRLINEYGPTEATITTAVNTALTENGTAIIGRPIANISIYILTKHLKLQPVGVPGELCISGTGISRGYLNNPEMTSEKFINHKFQAPNDTKAKKSPGPKVQTKALLELSRKFAPGGSVPPRVPGPPEARLYRTSDLARWLPDGNIEFLGRVDQQVKIRGLRIELGEIESRLLTHPEIKEAVILKNEDNTGDNFLCAYYEESSTRQPASGLKEYLAQFLPDYMLPAYFIKLEKIPLTPNGKIDRKALAKYPTPNPGSHTHSAPRNKTEDKLNRIWADILGTQKQNIGIDDDFFQLGGHSLRATAMSARIHKEFNVKLPLTEIFKNPTIRTLSGSLKEYDPDKYVTIQPAEKKDYYISSAAQKRLYVLQQMELENTAYNMPQTIPLAEDTDPGRLEEVFIKLIRLHESLRTTFHMIADPVTPGGVSPVTPGGVSQVTPGREIPVQKVHTTIPFKIEIIRPPTDGSAGDQLTAAQRTFLRPFDLTQAPLLRVGILKVKDTTTDPTTSPENLPQTGEFLLLDMHHIITDGTSQEILTNQFFALYNGESFPPLKLQYRDYAEWQNSNIQKELVKRQEKYWKKIFVGELPVLELPWDYPRPVIQSFEGHHISFRLNQAETGCIKETANQNGTTLYMTILSIFTILLSKLSGQEDIIVGTPTEGRRHADLENIIGMFVNTLAMRNYPDGRKTFKKYLNEIKKNTLQAFENQDYQFEDVVDRLSVRRDTGRNPIFDVMFNLLNQVEYKKQNMSTPSTLSIKSGTVGTSKFDLTLSATDTGERIHLHFEYCTKLFKEETIKKFITYFKGILQAVSNAPHQKISDIEIITEEEKKQILYDFNDTAADYPRNKTIHRLFEEQVEKTPDNTATVGNGKPVGSGRLAVGKQKIKDKKEIKEQLPQIGPAPGVGGIHESPLQHPQYTVQLT
ncbi:MAG: amino acid adenylation domain-containing protein, partial [bacterium]|nr:amino acid adenylation domain-containing protein [bacterium]